MGGYQVGGGGTGDDGYDEDGYDESQRAEILEATRDGPTDGMILTDLSPDLGDDPDSPEDDLRMIDDELGEEDDEAELTAESAAEDEVQADFDEDRLDELDEADEDALEP
ncbi:DNA primase [Sphingomonas sp. AOB5]|uniref:DNA primase n=1 Tax=Sphingomonas sp. AOB5 TaxID=3034017 RepID=UPI0023F819DD|nr:DNA primase [Sphingomonas sp. AOB5]MDF7777323.1 DNA primase [Sphingomonas sp. AOB5]